MDMLWQYLKNGPTMGVIAIVLCIMFLNCLTLSNGVGRKFYSKFSDIKPHGKSAVVTNCEQCTAVGIDILKRGGSVADAAIASLLCEGVSNPHSMGIGGGFLLTIYNKVTGTAEVLNARECAPLAADKYMFGKPNDKNIEVGGLAAAVPGELKGYWELHVKYGKMNWADLFQPAISMCRDGIYVSQHTAKMLSRVEDKIMNSSTLKAIFVNENTGKLFQMGEYMKRPRLAETLDLVAQQGPEALYNGILTKNFVEDVQEEGGILSVEDLERYKPKWEKALINQLPGGLMAMTVPSPGSGEMVLTVLDILSEMLTMDPVMFWHRLVEAVKFAFGIRTMLNGPKIGERNNFTYNKFFADEIRLCIDDSVTFNETAHYFASFDPTQDAGTCHLGILGPNGDGIAVTSTINSILGAMFASKSTGIILNNEMMDFAIPYHHPWKLNPANYIEPMKQPMSSMCPTIIVRERDKNVRLIIGAAGGPKIITSTIQVLVRNLWLKQNIISAVKARRLHHQLRPMTLEYEEGFPEYILRGLAEKGHKLVQLDTEMPVTNVVKMPVHSTVNAISVEDDVIYAVGDPRRSANAEIF